MVAYDIEKRSLLDRSAYAGQMEKAMMVIVKIAELLEMKTEN